MRQNDEPEVNDGGQDSGIFSFRNSDIEIRIFKQIKQNSFDVVNTVPVN